MSLSHLRSFLEVYRQGSISEAARLLGLTQPAVSAQLAGLENQLGRALFERHARGVRPTAAADDLAAGLGQNLDRAEAAFAAVKARSPQLTGVVRLAGPAELLAERIAPFLPPLLRLGLTLRVLTGDRERIYAALFDDQADLALTASPPDDPRLAAQGVGSETLLAVAAPALAWEASSPFSPTSQPLLAYDLDLPLIRAWLAANQLTPPERPPVFVAPDLRLLRALAIAGAGWTVLPDYLCAAALAEGRLREIAAPLRRPSQALHLVWAKGALRHPRIAFARDQLLSALTAAAAPA